MTLLTAAVVVFGALCLLNLVLTFGVIRRLREHADLLSRTPESVPRPILAPGERVGEFTATATDGTSVGLDPVGGPTLVAFFSPDCFACEEQLPDFVEYAPTVDGGRERVLAVVVGAADTAGLAERLAPVARVVIEAPAGPVAGAFAIRGFPAFCWLGRDGEVVASGHDLSALRASAPA